MNRLAIAILLCGISFSIGSGLPVGGYASRFPVGQAFTYSYVTETLLNEAHRSPSNKTHAHRDVGLKFAAEVTVTVVWNDQLSMLVKMAVSNPSAVLESISRRNTQKELTVLPRYPLYFHWKEGRVLSVYSSPEDSRLSVNIKKGIVSLLQLANVNKQRTETDASGTCDCTYIVDGPVIHKTKENCVTADQETYFRNVNPLLELSKKFRSETVYTTRDEVLESARSSETMTSRVRLVPALATDVTVTQELLLKNSFTTKDKVEGDNVEEVIKRIAKSEGALSQGGLTTVFESYQCGPVKCREPAEVLDQYCSMFSEAATPGPVSVDLSHGFLELVQAVRRLGKADRLKSLLHRYNNTAVFPVLLDALTAAQTEDAQRVVMEALNFNNPRDISLPERYLLTVAFSTHPSGFLLKQLLLLYKMQVSDVRLRESVGEALGAVVYTYWGLGQSNCKHQIVQDIETALVSRLESCQDVPCRLMNIRALRNAGLVSTVPLLLNYATGSRESVLSEEALRALERMDREHLCMPQVRETLKEIFHQSKRGYDSAVRTLALTYLLETRPSEADVRAILWESLDPWNVEYSLYIRERVFNAAQSNDELRSHVRSVLNRRPFNNYAVMASQGKSMAFSGMLGALTTDTAADYLLYVENSRAGILKRSGMHVGLESGLQTLPVYNFGIYAAGMEALLGKDVDPEDKDNVATAGIALDLLGVSLRPISFFQGSAGLMGAVWNAPSELTSALQTTVLLQDHSERLHLQNGLVVELDVSGAISLHLSGSLSVSLWSKNAHSLILNSASYAVRGSVRFVTSSFRAGVGYRADAAADIHFQSDTDFYDGIKTCLQMYRPEVHFRHYVDKFEYVRGIRKGYTARIARKRRAQPVCYPLPQANYQQCRELADLVIDL